MHIQSAAIRKVVEMAEGVGNAVKSVSTVWRPKQTIFMAEPMSPAFKAQVTAELPELRPYSEEGTPHNPADEGFVAVADDVVISFPAPGEIRRWY